MAGVVFKADKRVSKGTHKQHTGDPRIEVKAPVYLHVPHSLIGSNSDSFQASHFECPLKTCIDRNTKSMF